MCAVRFFTTRAQGILSYQIAETFLCERISPPHPGLFVSLHFCPFCAFLPRKVAHPWFALLFRWVGEKKTWK